MNTKTPFIFVRTLFALLVLVHTTAYAQSPQAIPYQALARDNAGNPVMNRTVSVRLSVREATAAGTVLYKETQSVTTNAYGLFNLNIGQGTVMTGTFASIDWGSAAKFVQVEIDLNGGSAYATMGTQQLMSVPYSLYSASGWNLKGNAGTSPATNFMGTTDATDLALRTNNTEKMRIMSGGNVGIGTTNALDKLHVAGNIRMVDGNQAAGKVLTSDANGTASWQNLNATQTNAWGTKGNTGVDTSFYIGFKDTILPLKFKVKNEQVGIIDGDLNNVAWGNGSLRQNNNGNANTAIGFQSLYSNSSGGYNTANGYRSLYLNTTGYNNTASGAFSLLYNTAGYYNTANGHYALVYNTTGNFNTASGANSLESNTTGNSNTASGSGSLFSNTTGNSNTASGFNSLGSNTTGNYNSACGAGSLASNTTGYYNTASGYTSLYSNTTGGSNTASGAKSLYNNTTGYYNSAFGDSALYSNTTGNFNTASGYQSLSSNTTGSDNTASGVNSLYWNTTGNSNTACGTNSLRFNTIGSSNTAIGENSLSKNTTGSNNTASGGLSLFNNTTGNGNTASGVSSLSLNTTGSDNTASGIQSLWWNTTGNDNTASGAFSLSLNTTGSSNTASGVNSLSKNQTGYFNSAFGDSALYSNISGNNNTASGYASLANTTSSGNTASGYASLYYNTGGYSNTAFGNFAGIDNTTGFNNTYLGYYTQGGNNSNVTVLGANATAAMSNCIILGNNINAGIGTSAPSLARLQVQGAVGNTVAYFSSSANSKGLSLVSDNPALFFNCYYNAGTKSMAASGFPAIINTDQSVGGMDFGTSDVANTAAGVNVACPSRMRITGTGRVGIGTTTPGGLFELSLDQGRKPSTSTWTLTSDARLKNIDGVYTKGLKEILQLQPVLYHYKNVGERTFDESVLKTQAVGFVAQDVQKVFPECVNTDDDGYLNLNVHAIIIAYTNAIKEQQDQIETLRKENASMKQTLTEILEKLNTGENNQK